MIVSGFRGDFEIIVTVSTLTESRETVKKYSENFHMDEAEILQGVETVQYFAEFVEPEGHCGGGKWS